MTYALKTGIDKEKVVDLFGNVFVEKCGKCKKLWPRSVIVPRYPILQLIEFYYG